MKIHRFRTLAMAAVLAGGGASALASGFEPLSGAGPDVMRPCASPPGEDECRVETLPGEEGYVLVAARSSDIVKNDIVVGTLFDRVWRDAAGNHIFGARVVMNAEPYDLTGLSFNVNDLFRQIRPGAPAAVAYRQVGTPPSRPLRRAGRTLQGLNEFETPRPERDNGWVDFRINANAAEVDGVSRPQSPWVLVKTRAPQGFSLQPFAIRVLSSDVADFSEIVEIFLEGYQPD